MPNTINTVLYCKAVEDSIRFVTIDKETGKQADFCKLFYPLGIDDGSLAFQHFYAQISHIQEAEKKKAQNPSAIDLTENTAKARRRLKKYFEEQSEADNKQQPDDKEHNLSSRQFMFLKGEIETNVEKVKNTLTRSIHKLANTGNKELSSSSTVDTAIVTQIISPLQDEFSETTKEIANTVVLTQQNDLLLAESDDKKKGRIVWTSNSADHSRVIVLASAGYGKSTLLKRIALFYSILQHEDLDPNEYLTESQFASYYNLPYSSHRSWNCIPCLIRLRGIKNDHVSISSIIHDNIQSILPQADEEDISKWLESIEDHLLLLLDGLDELPDGLKYNFLKSLGDYLETNPNIRVILSSRVSGLTENGVKEELSKMGFHGRTIMPLSDNDVLSYCNKWIDVMSETDSDRESFSQLISSIQVEEKYKYLRDFMRKPLELTIILKQIVKKALSYNRWEMFRDMLWSHFTEHVPTAQKQGVFDDTMLFLSIISKYLQDQKSMFFYLDSIDKLINILRLVSFQTLDFIELNRESIIEKLNHLASNIGIVEKDDTQEKVAYTFPIRAYQEFLTAYACCHIQLNIDKKRLTPVDLLIPHINDSYWNDVILYSILDMETNHSYMLEDFKSAVFENCTSEILLQSIIESKVYIDFPNATKLCEINFRNETLDDRQLDLLDSCLHSEASRSFRKALLNLYKSVVSSTPGNYIDAVALSQLYKVVRDGELVSNYLQELLWSTDDYKRFVGAGTISLLSRSLLDEVSLIDTLFRDSANNNASDILKAVISMNGELFVQLQSYAVYYNSSIFVQALTDLWVTKLDRTSQIPTLLDEELFSIVFSHIIDVWKKDCTYRADSFIVRLFYTISAFPISILSRRREYPYPLLCYLKALHSYSLDAYALDRVAFTVIQLTYGIPFDSFMNEWIWSICNGISSKRIRKTGVSLREQNHFLLLSEQLFPIEEEYRVISRENFNNSFDRAMQGFNRGYSKPSELSKRIIDLAVDYYQEEGYGQKNDNIVEDLYIKLAKGEFDATAATNLAFLLRNGKIQAPLKELDMSEMIYKLLSPGVKDSSPYALINMALKLIDDEKYSDIKTILDSMDTSGWYEVVSNWWHPMLWVRKHTEEGALVCLMANKFAGITLPDHDEMINLLSRNKEVLSYVLLN